MAAPTLTNAPSQEEWRITPPTCQNDSIDRESLAHLSAYLGFSSCSRFSEHARDQRINQNKKSARSWKALVLNALNVIFTNQNASSTSSGYLYSSVVSTNSYKCYRMQELRKKQTKSWCPMCSLHADGQGRKSTLGKAFCTFVCDQSQSQPRLET